MIYSNMLWEAYELDLEQLAAYPIGMQIMSRCHRPLMILQCGSIQIVEQLMG